jgi:hypothetical protein
MVVFRVFLGDFSSIPPSHGISNNSFSLVARLQYWLERTSVFFVTKYMQERENPVAVDLLIDDNRG